MTKHLPKDLSPNTITLGFRISTYEFWGEEWGDDTNNQTIAQVKTQGDTKDLRIHSVFSKTFN